MQLMMIPTACSKQPLSVLLHHLTELLALNEKLSGKRGTAADKFITNGIHQIEAATQAISLTTEQLQKDWEGFKEK
jgi:hypothetical protein